MICLILIHLPILGLITTMLDISWPFPSTFTCIFSFSRHSNHYGLVGWRWAKTALKWMEIRAWKEYLTGVLAIQGTQLGNITPRDHLRSGVEFTHLNHGGQVGTQERATDLESRWNTGWQMQTSRSFFNARAKTDSMKSHQTSRQYGVNLKVSWKPFKW